MELQEPTPFLQTLTQPVDMELLRRVCLTELKFGNDGLHLVVPPDRRQTKGQIEMQLSRDEFMRLSLSRADVEGGATAVATPPSSFGNFAVASSPRTTDRDSRLASDSALMQDARKAAEVVGEQPDMREHVVASLRERVESGMYKVSGEAIAEMMLRRMMADRMN